MASPRYGDVPRCPPPTDKNLYGKPLFRLTEGPTSQPQDFGSIVEEWRARNPDRAKKMVHPEWDDWGNDKRCNALGLSCSRSRQGALTLRRRMRARKRDRLTHLIELTVQDASEGVLQGEPAYKNKNEHVTWWPPEEFDRTTVVGATFPIGDPEPGQNERDVESGRT